MADAVQAVDASSAESVAGALQRQHVGLVHDVVDHRCGDDLASGDASQAGELQVRGQNQRGAFVTTGDELVAWPQNFGPFAMRVGWCHSVVATEGGCGGAEDVVV